MLRDLGFRTTELPFDFSAFPGRLGTPLAGAWLAVAESVAAVLATRGRPGAAAVAIIIAAGAGMVFARWMMRGSATLPLMRERGVNLEARRGDEPPRVWLAAHVDSKSQPVPMLARAAGIALLGVMLLAGLALAAARVSDGSLWSGVVVVAWIGALPVMLAVVGAKSPGALDNASGVAAVLEAAAMLPREAAVGVLITDAEELGLAGACAWVAGSQPAIALNCDGVDDVGWLTVMYSRGRPAALVESLRRAAGGARLRAVPMIPGVLADNVAFTAAGWRSVTLSRGRLRTLRRIHTTADDLGHLRGGGIAEAGEVLARAALELCR